ncbi:hypothetical protein OHA98_40455 [Streptomyces sp. NBC_00654]|uniref:hypothetical protein n=1 Tax=Streptomyces sp. NBC_00654 TaxID=2975799 RepID=UPI00225AEC15|nr:hypothetical protein [Streptomyces sp. NBC_00654]MCX4970905.1 hypothetical protein [Streptomyces sp. NBC_00654]
MRVFTVVGAVRLAVDLHTNGDYTRDLPTLTAVIDHAIATSCSVPPRPGRGGAGAGAGRTRPAADPIADPAAASRCRPKLVRKGMPW